MLRSMVTAGQVIDLEFQTLDTAEDGSKTKRYYCDGLLVLLLVSLVLLVNDFLIVVQPSE